MKKQKITLLLKTIISALLFSFAFLFVDWVGFFIIPALFLLFLILHKRLNDTTIDTLKQINHKRHTKLIDIPGIKNAKGLYFFALGLIWGAIVFSLHTIWFYELLVNKSGAGWLLSVVLYLFVIIYGSVLTGLFFYSTNTIISCFNNFILKLIVFFIVFAFYISFISKHFLFFVSNNFGYPFINPLIPLAKYKVFLFLIGVLNLNFGMNYKVFFPNKLKVVYLKPLKNIHNKEVNAQTAALLIYNQISNLDLFKMQKEYENIIIVSPETFYPYPLNRNKYALDLWDQVIPQKTHLFLGSQRRIKKKNYQTIYQIEMGRIINFYDKTHRVPFAEKIPKKLKSNQWSKDLFLNKKEKFSKGKIDKKQFYTHEFLIQPFICSDFFCKRNKNKTKSKLSLVIVNDSWFIEYFKTLMKYFALLRSNQLGINILYVNHNGYRLIKPYYSRLLLTL